MLTDEEQVRIENLEYEIEQLNGRLFKYSFAGSKSLVGQQVVESGFLKSRNYSSTAGWQLRPDGATIRGGLSVTSLDIPDTTTTNSFHVESDGDSWWGATTFAAAPASISKAGVGTFKNISIGGASLQYEIGDAGLLSFGDGSDGSVTFDGSTEVLGTTRSGSTYTLDRDVYYTTATINSGIIVNGNGFRLFASSGFTNNGTIHRNGTAGVAGTAGSDGGDPSVGVGGSSVSLASRYLSGAPATGAGGNGGGGDIESQDGVNGSNGAPLIAAGLLNSRGANGGAGGAAAGANAGTPGSGGTGGTTTPSLVKLIANWHLATLLDIGSSGSTVKFAVSGAAAGGGGGSGNNPGAQQAAGGGGGSGGTSGGILAIYARTITNGTTGVISANGGAGGAGGAGGNNAAGLAGGGGGGGGGGGNGGIVVLVYNSLTNNGSITASAGSGGVGGSGGTGGAGTPGAAGTAGDSGSSGRIYQFQLSL